MLATQSTSFKTVWLEVPRAVTARRLASLILLGGAIRPSPLQGALGRPLTDLPVDADHCLLDIWRADADRVARRTGAGQLATRVLVGRSPGPPTAAGATAFRPAPVELEEDPTDFRGTGGLLRDIALEDGDPDDYLLVANLAQLIVEPLADLVWDMVATGADVTVAAHRAGTPATLMLVRRGCLAEIPEVGFVDLKEQGLAAIARRHRVSVLHRDRRPGLPLRTLADYVRALRQRSRSATGSGDEAGAFAEDWAPAFSLVEPGAAVGEGAQVLDSVVLRGGVVEPGAVLVRSLVCPGGVARRGRVVVDRLVTGSSPRGRGR